MSHPASSGKQAEDLGEEPGEFLVAHLPRSHGEFAVLDCAQPRYIAANANVIRWVGKNELGPFAPHEDVVDGGIGCVTTEQNMLAEPPHVSDATDGRALTALWNPVFRLFAFVVKVLDDAVNLGGFKTRQIDVEPHVSELLQFDCKDRVIPARLFSEAIVRENIGALVRLVKMREADAGDSLEAEHACSRKTSMACDDLTFIVDQDRVVEAEPLDAFRDQLDLLRRMGAGIARVGLQRVD